MGVTLTLKCINTENKKLDHYLPITDNMEFYEPIEHVKVENPILIIPNDKFRYVMPARMECDENYFREKIQELDFLFCIVLAEKLILNGKTFSGEGDNLYGFYGNCYSYAGGKEYKVQPLTTLDKEGKEYVRICKRNEILEFFANLG